MKFLIKKCVFVLVTCVMCGIPLIAKPRKIHLKWVHTSDVHGSIFAYDFLKNQPTPGGLSAIYAYTDSLRRNWDKSLILTDGGDVLQGQPTAYYYNYVDTISDHLVAKAMNAMRYDAAACGNHDIEAGHAVYDRWHSQLRFPLLGANVIEKRTGRPYFQPYTIIKRKGVKIAILGMTTPAIPHWLPDTLWSGLIFEDICSVAKKWVSIIREKEKPDLLVGLFHSGFEGGIVTNNYTENAVEQVAREVKEFDIIFYGHDHYPRFSFVQRADGTSCLTMGPTNAARKVAVLDIILSKEKGKVRVEELIPDIVDMTQGCGKIATSFEQRFARERESLISWLSKPIGHFTRTILEREALFGSSAFIDLIHRMQLDLTGADVSFAAPLSFDSRIDSGDVYVRDMFLLYKFENFLYTMRMSGREIKDYLEYCYGQWTNQMKNPQDHLLLFEEKPGSLRRKGLKQLYYNLDSASGINYTVDVTKPVGERVTILSMRNGRVFSTDSIYRVALNSYRGNGGGELMTLGAGIPKEELKHRLLSSTDKDLRYYLMQKIMHDKVVTPQAIHNWRFIPEIWTIPASKRDSLLLFDK